MSQLNPDAKEFVPVSPTRNNAVSPVPNFNRDVVDDTLVARSPRRAMPMDNYVPSPEEFCRGIKQRPSELFEELEKDIENNEQQNQNGHQLSHQEIMQNLLNGKDPSEIEFHPSNYNNLICNENEDNKENVEKSETPVQPEDTNAVVDATGDADADVDADVDTADFTTFVPRSQDPMSMSFYQDKNEEGTEFSTNPFDDLNKVQMLPDDVDDIPQSNQSTDAEIHVQEKSPVNTPIQNDDVCELPKSPELQPEVLEHEQLEQQKQEEEKEEVEDDVCSLPKSPIDAVSPVHNVCELPQSPAPLETCEIPKSPLPHHDACELPKSPLESDVCEIPKFPIHIDVSETSKSPMLDAHSPMELPSPAGPLSPKSPIPELTGLVSPDITASIKDENVSAEISEATKSPIIMNQTPIEELEQQAKSPAAMDVNVDVAAAAAAAATPEIADLEIKSPLPNDEDIVAEASSNPIVEDADIVVTETSNVIEDEAAASAAAVTPALEEVDVIVCELNKEASDVQELITDAIQDITSDIVNQTTQEQCADNIEISEEAKYLSEHITNIANEINEITEDESNIDNNINDFINNVGEQIVENTDNLLECIATTTTTTTEPLNDLITEKTEEAKSPELINNTSIVESEVAPSDIMNSFLDRSVIPEVTSPLSPPEKFEQECQERPKLWTCEYPLLSQYDIKCETIQPEFPVHTIASPSEESKGNDTPPPTPAHVTEEPELKLGSPEPQKIVEAVEKLNEQPPVENKESAPIVAATAVTAAAAVAAVAAGTTAINKTSGKPKAATTTAATKKVPSKTSPTSPSKTLASKTSTTAKRTTTTAAAPKVTSTTTTAAKLASAKPKTTTTTPNASPKPIARSMAAAPKPKTPTTAASKLTAEKKPLTNGDAKVPPIRQSLLKKTTTTTSTVGSKPTPASTTAATSKVSLTKTSTTTSRPLANGTAKPALSATKTSARPSLTSSSSAAPKPRPASLTSKSTTAASSTKAAPLKTSSTTATKSPVTTAAKPKATSTATAPRPRMALTAKTAVKTADTEKQIKETANKQISASRTSTTRTSSTTTRTSTNAIKKAAPLTNRTSTTTRTTTVKSSATGKKPTEVTRTTITKTKSSPVKPNVEQNGVVNVIQEITTVSVVSENDDNSQLQLVKDNSPVDAIPPPVVDNSQLPPPMEIIAD